MRDGLTDNETSIHQGSNDREVNKCRSPYAGFINEQIPYREIRNKRRRNDKRKTIQTRERHDWWEKEQ